MATTAGDRRERGTRRVAGVSAVASGLLLLVASPLYMTLGTPPPLRDAAGFARYLAGHHTVATTTKLVDALYIAGFIVFVSGFRSLVRRACPQDAWIADLVFGAGLVQACLVLVGNVLAGGAALDSSSNPDPAVVRALTEASLLAFGAIGFLMTALFLAAAGHAIRRMRMPRLLGWTSWILVVLNLAAVPAIYRGSDFMETMIWGGNAADGPYSYLSSVAGLLYIVWLVALGVAILRYKLPQASGLAS